MDRIIFMKSQNFEFLRKHNPVLANLGGLAEAVLHIDPGSALTRLRSFAEELTKSIYGEEKLPQMPRSTFSELIRDRSFEASVDRSLLHQLNFLRVQGNDTAHGAEGDVRAASVALGTAHQLAAYMGIKYYGLRKSDITEFTNIPDPSAELKNLKQTVSQYKSALDKKAEEVDDLIETLDKERAKKLNERVEPTEAEQSLKKAQSESVADSLEWDEAKTRHMMIDVMLVQAGWDISNKEQVFMEMPVTHMDSASGKGYIDYALLGADGEPIAIIEAKRSGNTSVHAGREQARLYADALVKMGKRRPVLFYSNGYETYIWDDEQYNTPREVYGFYSEDSLEYLLYQRQYRQPNIEQLNPDVNIAGRSYQIEAIKTIAHHFQSQRRKALIVQATGTGKTRVSIALAELLLRGSWGKRVLFLCDRKELRVQADDAFKNFLPSEPRCVIGEKNQIDQTARIYIGTYPGMMGRFHQLDIGFFDLIIADESHRSVYNKYRDLFEYFDALQVGLTATPVKFIARNTFDLFGCESTDPTFEFGLDAAINNEPPYLSSFKVKDMTTEFLRDGIHYNDLTEDQQRQLEEDLGEDEAKNTRIAGKDIGRKIFSEDTDRIILENLMNNGFKDATNSLVGKTIIFAQRQDHAEHLEKLFCKLYPQYGAKVCKVIHNKVPKVETLIKEFKKGDNDFRIAISVDMLDTGIDVPEVVNLVFAKPVKSWVKFWQMIGRGTRLCENLFGPGKHKTEFVIFDHYSNFAYFDEEYVEAEGGTSKSLLQSCFETRIGLAQAALKTNNAKAFDTAIALIKADLNDLPESSIAVKRELRNVHTLQQTNALQSFGAHTQKLLLDTLAPLMGVRVLRDQDAIKLDRLIAEIETCFIQQASCVEDGKGELLALIEKLAVNIQAVRQKDAEIEKVRSATYWDNLSIEALEHTRTQLRSVMKYKQKDLIYYQGVSTTKAKENLDNLQEGERAVYIAGANEAMAYRRRLKDILDKMVDTNPILQKVYQDQPVDASELLSLTSTILTSHPGVNLKVLNEFYGRTAEQLHITVRQLIGMDPQAVELHFQNFLHAHPNLTAQQVRFMNLLKNYIALHGTITVEKLYDSPFDSISHEGIDGVFQESDVSDLVSLLRPFLEQTPTANS